MKECPFDKQCKNFNDGDGISKCLPCPKWEGSLDQPIKGPEYFKMDITDIPSMKNHDYILAVMSTLPEKQAIVLFQRHYLRYSRERIRVYHGFKTKSAVSNIIQRATENVLKKLKWRK